MSMRSSFEGRDRVRLPRPRFDLLLLLVLVVSSLPAPGVALAQSQTVPAASEPLPIPDVLRWRNIGPNRGGRSIAAAGHSARPHEYYFGATGGGLWKTTDGGTTWRPVTDGQIGSSSVGAVAVSASDPDVVYVGMGETQLRGNVQQGDGVYKSTDAGSTWVHLGLGSTQAIARIRVDPTDPDRVYVAALGHPYGPNEERGVYRSKDGGRSWEKVLYRSERAGAVDLTIDPSDPRILYATLWEVYRKPWLLWSGGAGSGLFKSTDGGDTWTELTRNPGMPTGVLGKVTVAVSGGDSQRVWANVEAEDGGLYRSDDGGGTWVKVNGSRDLWQRSFYFMRVVADPQDRETVYVLNFLLHKSTDGGRTFTTIAAPHVDHHDLWIDPNDPLRMINANDGGANVSINGGVSWTNQAYPTAQIYRVATTGDFPYHVCGAQQDNSTVCVSSEGGHLHDPDAALGDWFYDVGGGENAAIAPDPVDADIFYAGATNTLTRYDRKTGQQRDVQPYPRLVMGEPAEAMRERWSWVYPLIFSPVDPDVLYAGSQHLWVTRDEGRSWRRISPDLTRADAQTMGDSGGPIILDQDGPEIYATIYAIAPSKHDVDVIWVGSDDGLVHLSRDGGGRWRDVSPAEMPPFARVSRIEASAHHPGTAYVVAKRYELDDRAPYIWKTHDYGDSWTAIIDGIRADDFVHVVREDPTRAGLLYAGTEHGVYVSYDDGARWQSLALNLPDVQVADLLVHGQDLVIATHGRSFYVLDDVTSLRQMTPAATAGPIHLFRPADAVRRPRAAVIDYYLNDRVDSLRLEILDADGRRVRLLGPAPRSDGFHRVRWDLRYPGATVFEGMVLEGGDPTRGPWAPPGRYRVRLIADGVSQTQSLRVRKDPRLTDVTDADLWAQFELARRIRDRTSAANEAVLHIRMLRDQLRDRLAETSHARATAAADAFAAKLSAVQAELYQVRNRSPKDKIAFPIKLNNRLSGLRWNLERGDGAPTEAHYRVFRELSAELDRQLEKLEEALETDLHRLNQRFARLQIEPVHAGMQR